MSTWNYLGMTITSEDLTPWERPVFSIHDDSIYDEDGYEYIEFPEDEYPYAEDDFNFDCYREQMYFGNHYERD